MENIALITGASGRIGSGLAKHLAAKGWKIALHYSSSKDAAQKVQAEIGDDCEIFQADLFKHDEVVALIPSVIEKLGTPNLLINNASIFEPTHLQETTEDSYEQNMAVHLKAPFFLTQQFAKHAESGNIINILDTYVNKKTATYFPYLISKKSLHDFTQMSARALAPTIRVNGIALGLTEFNDNIDPAYIKYRLETLPIHQVVTLEEIARTIDFLLAQSAITGEAIFLDNGAHLL